jgi:methionyl-tRNA synthetase/tRNA-binding protein
VVLVNLEPKTIRGFTSEGMLLAASTEDKISLIGPYEEISIGSKIH